MVKMRSHPKIPSPSGGRNFGNINREFRIGVTQFEIFTLTLKGEGIAELRNTH